MGNPLTYDGKTFAWTAGRQLETLTDPSQGIKVFYTYNADGFRTQQKICPIHTDGTVAEENAIVYDEIWKDSKLVGRTITRPDGSVDRMTFFYDNNGEPDGFSLNGAFYYYWKTLQGDIRYLLDPTETRCWAINMMPGATLIRSVLQKMRIFYMNAIRAMNWIGMINSSRRKNKETVKEQTAHPATQ